MISERALALAVERGVLTGEQVDRLHQVARELNAETTAEPQDEERLRFVTGFADIFVAIGLVLFLGALAFLMNNGAGSTPMFAGLAACAWLLAEFFTGRRRMALPSIILLVVFVAAIFLAALQVFTTLLPARPGEFSPAPLPTGLAAIVATLLAVMHYVRFRVPITIAAGCAGLIIVALALILTALPGVSETGVNAVIFICGCATFALAMRFDLADPERVTRRTDVAFWLHMLAAPLIVHPLARIFLHGLGVHLTDQAALGILWVFLLLGVVAVIIDRRAILVSGLIYAGTAFGTLIRASFEGASAKLLVPVVILTLGAFILLLSAGWQPLRRALLKRLPETLSRRLPRPLVPSQT
jgi:hypothetical protein